MTAYRRIQIIAAAVIANGLLALTGMAPGSALASSCNPKLFCEFISSCSAMAQSVCAQNAPPGCTVASTQCAAVAPCFDGNKETLFCNYH